MRMQYVSYSGSEEIEGTVHRYLVLSWLLEYLGVWQEKQLRAGLSINIIVPGEICQVIDMASFL